MKAKEIAEKLMQHPDYDVIVSYLDSKYGEEVMIARELNSDDIYAHEDVEKYLIDPYWNAPQ